MRAQYGMQCFAVAHISCPGCRGPMRLAAILPSATNPHADEIAYYCAECERELRHASKPVTLSLRSDIEP